jgi:preprotein translocase subunit SecD
VRNLGPSAAAAAQSLATSPPADPSQIVNDTALMAKLKPFESLTPAEVAALPARVQFLVPQVTCATLNNRPPNSIVDERTEVVACGPGDDIKLLVDKATVDGGGVGAANATVDSGGLWIVEVTFSSAGAASFRALSADALNNTGGAFSDGGPSGGRRPAGAHAMTPPH